MVKFHVYKSQKTQQSQTQTAMESSQHLPNVLLNTKHNMAVQMVLEKTCIAM